MLYTGAISLFDSASLLSPNHTHFPLTGPLFSFTSKNSLFLSSSQQIQQTHLSFRRRDNGMSSSPLRAPALNNRGRKSGTAVMETDGADFDDYGDEEEEEEDVGDDEEDDDDEEGLLLPLEEMKRWLENKPRGFGEGKVYDTSVEEKLLQEIEQSREAQIANINKLKNDPVKTNPKKEEGKKQAPEVIPSGTRVHLVYLPKKKNIHRDLKSAFEGVPGIINISPAVSGNKKTKDPICKGFAFVDFKSEEDATRFVQIFSGQSISFGKIQKQIKCEVMNSTSSKFVDEHSAENAYTNVEPTASGLEEVPDVDSDVDYDTSDSWMEAASDASNPDGELDSVKLEDIRESPEIVSVSELNGRDKKKQVPDGEFDSTKLEDVIESLENVSISELNGRDKKKQVPDGELDSAKLEDIRERLEIVSVSKLNGRDKKKQVPDGELDSAKLKDIRERRETVSVSELNGRDKKKQDKKSARDSSSSSNQLKKIRTQTTEKKIISKGKVKKVPKLNIPGSAKRLQVKEKALLTDVFSKYAGKVALASKEDS